MTTSSNRSSGEKTVRPVSWTIQNNGNHELAGELDQAMQEAPPLTPTLAKRIVDALRKLEAP